MVVTVVVTKLYSIVSTLYCLTLFNLCLLVCFVYALSVCASLHVCTLRPKPNYATLDVVMRANTKTAQELPHWNTGLSSLLLRKMAAKRVLISAFFHRWHSRRSREVFVAQTCGRERVTSRRIFGGKSFQNTVSCASVRYLNAKPHVRGALGGVVYNRTPFARFCSSPNFSRRGTLKAHLRDKQKKGN